MPYTEIIRTDLVPFTQRRLYPPQPRVSHLIKSWYAIWEQDVEGIQNMSGVYLGAPPHQDPFFFFIQS